MNDSAADGGDDELALLAVLPRLTQLSTVLNRSSLVDRAMDQVGLALDRPAMSVLVVLRMAGKPLRIGEIATRMHVVGPHVTRLLNELERRDLARRVPDPHDQRARLIELADEGAAAADRYLRAVVGLFTGAMTDWSKEDRATFGRLLGRFADDLAAHLVAVIEKPQDV